MAAGGTGGSPAPLNPQFRPPRRSKPRVISLPRSLSPISIRHEMLAGRIGGIDGRGGETKRSFAPGDSGRWHLRHHTGGRRGGPQPAVTVPPLWLSPVPLTRRQPTGEWARPAAPNCAGSSSRARAGWRPDTAGRPEGTVRVAGERWGAWGRRQEQAELLQERVQAGDTPPAPSCCCCPRTSPQGQTRPKGTLGTSALGPAAMESGPANAR